MSTHTLASFLPSTDNGAEYQLLQGLGMANANFACGGSLKVNADGQIDHDNFHDLKAPPMAAPVVFRWDGDDVQRLQLPSAIGEEDKTTASLLQLLSDCTPATFGHKGKDVYDESYRKAAKLDNTQFSTNFHPHDYGILTAISQALLPRIVKSELETDDSARRQIGLYAELYKLNIYSSPSGKFQPHVDTPRGPAQFGSLVVCLPYAHQGGGLRVAHEGQEVVYDWSNKEASDISWAAFYSDCEHEVFEVTSGHRITLTYNLYVSEHLGSVIGPFSNANPTMYPLYEKAFSMLNEPSFMEKGGLLGFYCTHQYAHTSTGAPYIPYALKGLDAVVFATFQYGLRLNIRFRPVLDYSEETIWYEDDEDDEPDDHLKGDIVGAEVHSLIISREGGCNGYTAKSIIDGHWPSERTPNIRWLNEPNHKEVALVRLTYGNNADIAWHYSSIAMFIEVPPFNQRFSTLQSIDSAG